MEWMPKMPIQSRGLNPKENNHTKRAWVQFGWFSCFPSSIDQIYVMEVANLQWKTLTKIGMSIVLSMTELCLWDAHVCFSYSLAIEFSICAEKKKKKEAHVYWFFKWKHVDCWV